MKIDVVGRNWQEAEVLLKEANVMYNTVITRPTKDFFKVKADCFYVIRQKMLDDGSLHITLAARLEQSNG